MTKPFKYIIIRPKKSIFSFLVLYMKELLQAITHNIVFSACTFESRTDVYRANNQLIDQDRLQQYEKYQSARVEWCPSLQRIEFMWVLIILYDEQGMLSHTNLHLILDTHLKRRDIEGLCEMLWKHLSKLMGDA